jgi:hypothetical protein
MACGVGGEHMGVHPRAKFRPVSFVKRLDRRELRRAVIVHTNGGGTDHGSLLGWWNRRFADTGERVGAHFQVMWDGTIEQYADTDRLLNHAFAGSKFAVGIETQDDNDPSRPWTKAQIDAILDICNWLQVPKQQLAEHGGDGIGWHRLHHSWNKSNHSCPGDVRLQQLQQSVIRRLGVAPAPGGLSMADVKDILEKLDDMSQLIRVGDRPGGALDTHDFSSLEGVAKKVDAARADINWLKAAMKKIAATTGTTLPPD